MYRVLPFLVRCLFQAVRLHLCLCIFVLFILGARLHPAYIFDALARVTQTDYQQEAFGWSVPAAAVDHVRTYLARTR